MRKFIIALVVVAAFLFVGCSNVTAGEVYNKEYEPARDWETTEPTYQMVCTYKTRPRYDGKGVEGYNDCQNTIVGWHQEKHHKPECYRLDFKNEEGDKGNNCVDQRTYDSVEIGEWYDEEGKDEF